MGQQKIECISLTKTYAGKNQVVDAVHDVNIAISENEMVILKGRSGAGKSTLLSLMSGLIKPTHGKVMFDNICISDLPNAALSEILLNRIGIIFQSFNLLPTYTVYENIEFAISPKGHKDGFYEDLIISLLDQFHLKDKAYLLPSELSVGQQQKVAIVRTLIKKPTVIFADEPTGSVDDETAGEIIQHLMELKQEKHITLVIATHGNIMEKYADKVYLMVNGQINNPPLF